MRTHSIHDGFITQRDRYRIGARDQEKFDEPDAPSREPSHFRAGRMGFNVEPMVTVIVMVTIGELAVIGLVSLIARALP